MEAAENSKSPELSQTLEPFIIKTLEFVNEQIPAQLLLWLENSFSITNLSDLPEEVLESTVANAINEHKAVPPSLWEKFNLQAREKCRETWLPTLEALLKRSSVYNEHLKVQLDLYRCVSPEKYEKLSKELLQKLLLQINEPLLLQFVKETCNKITRIYGEAYEWMLQNKLGLENQINEIKEQYDNELASYQVPLSGNDNLLSHHSQLKTKFVEQLQTRFEAIQGSSPLTKRLLVSYELQLCGLLNKSFDQNARERKLTAEPIQIPNDTMDFADERSEWLPAPQRMKMPIENDEAVSSTNCRRRMKRSFPDIDSILVWMKGEFTNVTKVGDTPIRYLKNKIIWSGTTATVYHGFYGDDTLGYREAAVKHFQERNIHIFENEMKVWKQIDAISNSSNVNVVSLLSYVKWEDNRFLATELAEADLYKHIIGLKKTNCTNYNQLLSYVYDVTQGLNWLHGRDIIHRDIKPQNVLIFSYEHDGSNQEIAKLTDFGISRVVKKDETGKDTHAAGTDDWSSPEVLRAKEEQTIFHNTKSQDIFSLGLTTYFTLTLGSHPFEYSDYWGRIRSLNIMDKRVSPLQLSDNPIADTVIQRMLNRSTQKRPTIKQILKHPLFWKNSKKLRFIHGFAIAIGEVKSEAGKNIREALDKAYLKMYHDPTDNTSKFNWLLKLDDVKRQAIYQRKSSSTPNLKEYNGKSISSLVKLVRDKLSHPKDLIDELLQDEHFGSDGQFDENKYAEYFLTTFPNLLLFLIKSLNVFDEFRQLKEKYFL